MNISQFIVLQFIAYLLTDFTFHPDKKTDDKNHFYVKNKFFKWHFLIALGLSWLLSFQLNFIFAAFAIALVHLVADVLKKYLDNLGLELPLLQV